MVWYSNNCSEYGWCENLSMAEKLNDHGMITCLTKQHDIKKIKTFQEIKKFIKI